MENMSSENTQDPLASLFEERDRYIHTNYDAEEKQNKVSQKDELTKVKKEEIKKDEENENEVELTKVKKEEIKKDEENVSKKQKDEFVKLQERLIENQKYARKNVQKVKNASKAVHNLIEEGILTEEEAKNVLNTLQSEGEEIEEEYTNNNSPFSQFSNIFKIAKKEFENIQKYTEDEKLQDKLNAFEYLLGFSSQDEIEEIYDELNDLSDNPVKLAKKIIMIGQEAYESFFKDLKKNGGIKNILKEKNKSVEQLQKKIDKLEKKLLDYESYDKPNYKIDDIGDSDEPKMELQDPIASMIRSRDAVRKR